MTTPATPSGISGALVTIEKDIVLAAEKALAFIRKAETAAPAVSGAMGVVLSAVEKALNDIDTAAKTPTQALSITFDTQTLADLKAVWPDLKTFVATLGIKLP
jgi:hypothetical protein